MSRVKQKLKRDLELTYRHLTRAGVIMGRISSRIGIERHHEYLERTLFEVEELLKLFDEDNKDEY